MVPKQRCWEDALERVLTDRARKALQEFISSTDKMLAQAKDTPEYRFDRNQIYEDDDR